VISEAKRRAARRELRKYSRVNCIASLFVVLISEGSQTGDDNQELLDYASETHLRRAHSRK